MPGRERDGRQFRENERAHGTRHSQQAGRCNVRREDQVGAFARRTPNVPPPQVIDVLAAVRAVNRHARRMRNRAREHHVAGNHRLAGECAGKKREYYRLKGQAPGHLVAEGRLSATGFHRFDASLHAGLLEGEGYSFHRPCAEPVGGVAIGELPTIEAKPKESGEARLRDALLTLDEYLRDKPRILVYSRPFRERVRVATHFRRVEAEENDDELFDGE